MIRMTVRMKLRPAALEEALKLFAELIAKTRAEAGCVDYAVCRHAERENELIMLEAWQDEAALNAHMQTPHFTTLVPQIDALREEGIIDKYVQLI